MTRAPIDTDPKVDARYRSMLLQRTPSERMVMAMGMFDTARAIMVSSLPDGLDVHSRRIELFTRTYGRELDQTIVDGVLAALRRSNVHD